jgi:hypothetical protein
MGAASIFDLTNSSSAIFQGNSLSQQAQKISLHYFFSSY